MQEKDSEAIRDQRKRRKRIQKMKHLIIFIVAGWILLSMILIICLFVQTISLERKVDRLLTAKAEADAANLEANAGNGTEGSEAPAEATVSEATQDTEELLTWEPVEPPAVGIAEEDNLAGEGEVHKVYLTFDDGPSEVTAKILDVLSQYNVKATFFVMGQEGEEAEAIYRRIVEEGHTLGMHSYSNKYSVLYQSKQAFEEDFHTLQNYLYEVTGTTSMYYRFPGGSSNQISNVPMSYFIHYLNEEQVIYYDWNVSAGDAASMAYTAEEMIANVTEDVMKYKSSVVLLHDSADKTATADMLGSLIEALWELNAEILPIDEQASVIQYVKADTVK